MFFDVAVLCAVRSIGHITGIDTKRSNHKAIPVLFKCCGRRLKFHCELPFSTRESCSSRTKINALVNRKILFRIQTVLFQDILKNHLRHTTFSSSQHFFSFQVTPLKIRHLFPCYQKVSRTLGSLCEVYHRVVGAFKIRVHGCFRSHKSDLRLPGNDRCHRLIRPVPGHQVEVEAFLCKISIFQCDILWGIKDRMCHLIQGNLCHFILLFPTSGKQTDHPESHQPCYEFYLFHPNLLGLFHNITLWKTRLEGANFDKLYSLCLLQFYQTKDSVFCIYHYSGKFPFAIFSFRI